MCLRAFSNVADDTVHLREKWEADLLHNRQTAVEGRQDLYKAVRESNFKNSLWTISMLESFPLEKARLSDYIFAVDVLAANDQWDQLESVLMRAGKSNVPIENILLHLLYSHGSRVPLKQIFGFPLSNQVLTEVLLLYKSQDICSALSPEYNDLATEMLEITVEALIDSSSPPDPLGVEHPKSTSLAGMLWEWKLKHGKATGRDLTLYMMHLVYHRRNRSALRLYDSNRGLHSHEQLEAVLLACAGCGELKRLTDTFDMMEQDVNLRTMFSAKRYETVIRALAYLNDSHALNDIYQQLGDLDIMSLGVYNALICAYTVRGDLSKVLELFQALIKQGILPSANTFSLVLKAYRDRLDLKGALAFVGDEMIGRYQFPLRNVELSLLLSLCAKRNDAKTAQYIWEWANKQLTPNHTSWQVYLMCHANCNLIEDAFQIANEMKTRNILGIESLTVLIESSTRADGDPLEICDRVIRLFQELQLTSDSQWILTLLKVFRDLNDHERFEVVLKELEASKIPKNASHFALQIEMLTRARKYKACGSLMREASKRNIIPNFPLIEKYFRSLTAPGNTTSAFQSAELAARNLLNDGYFDPLSSLVPRTQVPVYVIEPVVRRLLKMKLFLSAKSLLDTIQRVRKRPGSRDEHVLWALYMETALASNNLAVLDRIWINYLASLMPLTTLDKPSVDGTAPVFKLPRKYRYNSWIQINIRINQLAALKRKKDLLGLPEQLKNLGLEMSRKNLNTYILALVQCMLNTKAFEVAWTLYAYNRSYSIKNISRRALDALAGVVHQVNYRKYGKVGNVLHGRAQKR